MRTGFAISSFSPAPHAARMALDRLSALTDCVENHGRGLPPPRRYRRARDLRPPVNGPCAVARRERREPARTGPARERRGDGRVVALAAGVGAPVVVHPGYYAWPRDRKRAEQQFRQSLTEPPRGSGGPLGHVLTSRTWGTGSTSCSKPRTSPPLLTARGSHSTSGTRTRTTRCRIPRGAHQPLPPP